MESKFPAFFCVLISNVCSIIRVTVKEVIVVMVPLEVRVSIQETSISSSGYISVRNKSDISKGAYEYIQNIKRKTGYRNTFIEKVIVNGTEDITEEVRKIDHLQIPPMGDIFW
jgi:hypothetical protein